MIVYDIIQKENRTIEELKYVFTVLFKGFTHITKYLQWKDITGIEYILDQLKLVSKSRLQSYYWCPFKFKMRYILRLNEVNPLNNSNQIMYDGFNLHLMNELFWNYGIKVNDFLNSVDLKLTIWKNYIKLFPKIEKTKFMKDMIMEFVNFEYNRITGIYNEVGKTRETIERYVFPIAHELMIENHDLKIMGIIDRVERATNDSIIYADYKYGKAKDYEVDYHKTFINREMSFYGLLPQGKNVYVVKNDKIRGDYLVPIKEVFDFNIKPYYSAMIFFQDIRKTAILRPINKYMLTIVGKQIDKYWSSFNCGMFPCNVNNSCYEWCGYYWDYCRNNPEWLEIDKGLERLKEQTETV